MRTDIIAIALFVLTLILMLWMGNASVYGQVPLDTPGANTCIYTPETIAEYNPLGRPAIVMARPFTWPTNVDAIGYLQQIKLVKGANMDYERASVAIQYTLSGKPQSAGQVSVHAYLQGTTWDLRVVPDITVRGAVHGYLFSHHPLQRANYGQLLTAIVNSPLNGACN